MAELELIELFDDRTALGKSSRMAHDALCFVTEVFREPRVFLTVVVRGVGELFASCVEESNEEHQPETI